VYHRVVTTTFPNRILRRYDVRLVRSLLSDAIPIRVRDGTCTGVLVRISGKGLVQSDSIRQLEEWLRLNSMRILSGRELSSSLHSVCQSFLEMSPSLTY